MNIHPVIVHFPVAFLTIYALLLVVYIPNEAIKKIKSLLQPFLAIVGFLGAVAADLTGQLIEGQFQGSVHALVEMHSTFAAITMAFFGVLALLELIVFLSSDWCAGWLRKKWKTVLLDQAIFILYGWPVLIVGLIGLSIITITGALGGALAYGPDFDPMVKMITQMLGVS